MRLKAAEHSAGSNKQKETHNSENFVRKGERCLQALAREGHQKTSGKKGTEEPGNGSELLHDQRDFLYECFAGLLRALNTTMEP